MKDCRCRVKVTHIGTRHDHNIAKDCHSMMKINRSRAKTCLLPAKILSLLLFCQPHAPDNLLEGGLVLVHFVFGDHRD